LVAAACCSAPSAWQLNLSWRGSCVLLRHLRAPFTLLQLTSRGAASGGSCVLLRNRLGWDDALDVWGVHGMGGLLGSILIGPLADASVGVLERSGPLLGKQVGHIYIYIYIYHVI
jgi:hypothetical protein